MEKIRKKRDNGNDDSADTQPRSCNWAEKERTDDALNTSAYSSSEETGIILSTSAVISGKNNTSPATSQSRRLETATSARKAVLSAVTQHAGETRPSRRQRFPTWASDEEDSSWELISKKKRGQKRAVFYVGNLVSSTTEQNLKRFRSSRSEKVGIGHVYTTFVSSTKKMIRMQQMTTSAVQE